MTSKTEKVKVIGSLTIELRDKEGKVKKIVKEEDKKETWKQLINKILYKKMLHKK